MPKPHPNPGWQVIEGDCVEELARLEPESIDAVVTDPPYGLEFMGKEWDRLWRRAANPADVDRDTPHGRASRTSPEYKAGIAAQEWHRAWATEALRVLKPGGHLLAFGGTRTYHRLACAVEDAGFEIRDSLIWLYGSGFPKSLDVSKAIDKAAGVEREQVGTRQKRGALGGVAYAQDDWTLGQANQPLDLPITAPATPEAAQWEGWGTALKPGHEPIVVARKPLVGTVAQNCLEHGTGALNIDGCRIEATDDQLAEKYASVQAAGSRENAIYGTDARDRAGAAPHDAGRWPANVVLSPEAAAELDAQSGESTSRVGQPRSGPNGDGWGMTATGAEYEDRGGASRFYYCAKASRAERNAGCEGFEKKPLNWSSGEQAPGTFQAEGTERAARNAHPTVKPIDLMRWLVRLVCPPDGTVLDPFTGSGTTGCAAVLEGFRFIGIEREPEYVEIAKARIDHWYRQPVQLDLEAA